VTIRQGALPSDWRPVRLKWIARLAYGDSLASGTRVDGAVPVYGSNGPVGTHERANTRSPVIVVGRKGSFGKLHYVNQPIFCIDTTYFVDQPKAHLRWLYYAMQILGLDGVSQDTGVPGLSREAAYDGVLYLPPSDVQRAIADFLDEKTAAIDALIAKKERLLALLDEKRQALITAAVTKGLDPSVPMKDSGVPWLGKIPQHWSIWRLGHALRTGPKNGLSPPTTEGGDGVPTFSISAVTDGVVRIADHLKYAAIDEREARPFQVKHGDILILRGNGNLHYVAKAGIVVDPPPEGCIYPDILIRLEPTPKVLRPTFLVALLGSSPIRAQIETFARTSAGIWKISGANVSAIRFPCPPLAEQRALEAHLKKSASEHAAARSKIERQVDLLREYRQAVITAAVTGELDAYSKQAQATEPAA
jgi:type I restriction enzyme S subunit